MRRIALSLMTIGLITLSAVCPVFAENKSAEGLSPLAGEQWDAAKAAHLLNRAGFGATPEEIIKLASMPLEQAVAYLLDYEKHPQLAAAELPKFDSEDPQTKKQIARQLQKQLKVMRETRRRNLLWTLTEALEGRKGGAAAPAKKSDPKKKAKGKQSRKKGYERMTQGMSAEERIRYLANRKALSKTRSGHQQRNMQVLRGWWVDRMIKTERQLEEKMALFWHGHFATGYKTVRNTPHMLQQNNLFRTHATGNFAELVLRIAKDPAMLRYLDGNKNVKSSPNENFARELMELFTIGIGNYTEKDIKEAARAFTGWAYSNGKKRKQRPRRSKTQQQSVESNGFVFRRSQHDFGQKTFMGQSGDLNGQDVINIILSRHQTARFIVTKLLKYFHSDNPDAQLVDGLATTFRENDYEIKPVLRQLFSSKAFYSSAVIGQQIKSPTQLLVGTAKLLGIGEKTFRNHALRTLPKLGQNLFEPPNVKGWDGGRAWVNSATLLIRYNLTRDLLLQSSREARKGYGKKGSKTKEQSKKKKSGQNDMQMEQMGQMDDQRKRSKRRRASQRPTIGLLKRFESYESADEVINHLILLFLQKPLPESRMAKLREVMSPEGVTFDPKSRQTQERIIKLIILITSIPEYQLC